MKKSNELRGKKVLVVGLGKTGVALSKVLSKLGAKVTVNDHKSRVELLNFLEQMEGVAVSYQLGGHPLQLFVEQDLIILSPGVSPSLKVIDHVAKSTDVPILSELEFLSRYELIKEPIIAIVGSNGKTSTSYLIKKFLDLGGVSCWYGGGYSRPLSSYVLEEKKASYVIAEVSSFQLELNESFCPKIIVVSNLTESHLERYGTLSEYVSAKRAVFKNISKDTVTILNADDNLVVELARAPAVLVSRIFYFSCRSILFSQIMNIGGSVTVGLSTSLRVKSQVETYNFGSAHPGRKGIFMENAMAAALVARYLDISPELIQKGVDEFEGLPHRLELVRKVGGVLFYNDSKSTNPLAIKKALSQFEGGYVILIMGGKETGLNYSLLQKEVKLKVKILVLIGENKERINRSLGAVSETYIVGTLEEALHISYQKSRIGDAVLMSPGSSGLDMFENFIDRGKSFRDLVNDIRG